MSRAKRRKRSESEFTEEEMALCGAADDWSEADLAQLSPGPAREDFLAENRAWIEAGRPSLCDWHQAMEPPKGKRSYAEQWRKFLEQQTKGNSSL